MNLIKDIKSKFKKINKNKKYLTETSSSFHNIKDFISIKQSSNIGCGASGAGFQPDGSFAPNSSTYFNFSNLLNCYGASPQPILFDLLGGNNGISMANTIPSDSTYNNPRSSSINIGNPQVPTSVQQVSGNPINYDNPYIKCPSNYFDQIMAQSYGGVMDIVDETGKNKLFQYASSLNPIAANTTNNNAANLWYIGQLDLGTGGQTFTINTGLGGPWGGPLGGSPGYYPNIGNAPVANSVFKTTNVIWIPPNMVMDILYFGNPQDVQAQSSSANLASNNGYNQYCQGINTYNTCHNTSGGSYNSMLWVVRIIGDSGDTNNSNYYVNPIDWCQSDLGGSNNGTGHFNRSPYVNINYNSPNGFNATGWANTPGNTFFANVDLSKYSNMCNDNSNGSGNSCSNNPGSGLVDLGCVKPLTYYWNNNQHVDKGYNPMTYAGYGGACCNKSSYTAGNFANMGMSFIVYYKSGYDSSGSINNNIPMTWHNFVSFKCKNTTSNPIAQCGVIGSSGYPQARYISPYTPPAPTPCSGTSGCSNFSAGCPIYTNVIDPTVVPSGANYTAYCEGAICNSTTGNCECITKNTQGIGQSLLCSNYNGDCTGVIACPPGFTSSCNPSSSVCSCYCIGSTNGIQNYPIQNSDGSMSCGICPANTTTSVDNATGYTICVSNTVNPPPPQCTANDQCAGCPTGMTPVCNNGTCSCSTNSATPSTNTKKIIEDVFGFILILILIIAIAVVSVHYYKKYKTNKSISTIPNPNPVSST